MTGKRGWTMLFAFIDLLSIATCLSSVPSHPSLAFSSSSRWISRDDATSTCRGRPTFSDRTTSAIYSTRTRSRSNSLLLYSQRRKQEQHKEQARVVYAIKSSSPEEAKAAAIKIKKCLIGVEEMQKAAGAGEWQKVADIVSQDIFRKFEATGSTLVRSDKLTAEDKVALGTIKRFGLIADAIITLGGLESELKAGGVEVAGGGSSSDAIIEEGLDEEGEEEIHVNGPEARRFLRLVRGALEEIDRIVSASILEED